MIVSTVARRLAAASLTAAALAAPLLMSPTAHAAAPDDGLLLTVSGSDDTWIRGVLLECPSASGSNHPQAAEACAALNAAGGDPDGLPGDPRRCAHLYEPVTATAEGQYDGRPVSWQRTFANACVLASVTGPVFRF
ncbi:subtilase-type protease inhibitor [Streptomyces sp. JH14]|uniref:SSI family serine proteinase inhibitor n=1 Tax=Streptomyces sp. JH14 TaxID=2793630 RepID=UPI0023F620C9|nr:SSI family serine proteinase inhibitor [Streptomyces sp. JH14]MDF6043390.1 subtilase-type protease inhibitor [Streptomyces sp. JH14]